MFQQINKVVVCKRRILYKYFADYTYLWFAHLRYRESIKVMYDLFAHFLYFVKIRTVYGRKKIYTLLFPFLMQGISRTFFKFIGTHAVQTLHEDITEHAGKSEADKCFEVYLEARISFETRKVRRDNRDLAHAGFYQCTSYESNIV